MGQQPPVVVPNIALPAACEIYGVPDMNMRAVFAAQGVINPVVGAPDFFARNPMICPECRAVTKDLVNLLRPLITELRAGGGEVRFTVARDHPSGQEVTSFSLAIPTAEAEPEPTAVPAGFVES